MFLGKRVVAVMGVFPVVGNGGLNSDPSLLLLEVERFFLETLSFSLVLGVLVDDVGSRYELKAA
jgi:hypothetical protein